MYIGKRLQARPLPMAEFDPKSVVKIAREHLRTISEPRRRQILENLIEHADAESEGDYERLMASCSQKRQSYANYGAEGAVAEWSPQSYEALEQHYRALIDMNLFVLHMEVEKLIVGADALMLDGIVHQLYPAGLIEPMFGVAVEPEGVYMVSCRTCIIFLFDEDGLGCGEEAYTEGKPGPEQISRVPDDQVPALFKRGQQAT